jgi:hypothetical protein
MRWRFAQPAAQAKASGPHRPSARVRWALAGSLVLHGAMAWMFFAKAPSKCAPRPETVAITFEMSESTTAPPAPAPALAETPSRVGALPLASPPRAKGAVVHGDAAKTMTEAAEVPVPTDNGVLQASGAPSDGQSAGHSDRLSTFRPAHPDLNGPMKFPAIGEKRDPLAPPTAKSGTQPRELPKVIQGGGGVTASVAEDGSIRFHDPKGVGIDHSPFQTVGSGVGVGVSGSFDLTDRVMKYAGQDAYASTKRKMADDTREQRLCMARRYKGERQKQELFTLSTKVRRIAARADLPAAQRRELVFAIWDECLEESNATTDYGAMARATIMSIAREAFPAGSDVAYQPADLLAFNGRRSSRQAFAPYDPSPMKRARHPDAGAPTECP